MICAIQILLAIHVNTYFNTLMNTKGQRYDFICMNMITERAHRGLKTAFQYYASVEGSASAFATRWFTLGN